jgi:molecular chaperone DnaK
MSMILCIDLGTTYSVMAYADENGTPHLVENAESEILTPSVVLIEDGVIEVGLSAANHAILKSDKVGQWIKRRIGDDDYRFQGLSPVEISAEILRKLKRDAEVQLSIPISQAVITCPLYFSAPEVENTKRAGELAGLEVMDIVKEPIAAAVYCAVSHQLSEGERLLVYDLGGRNFDVTILEFKRGEFIPLALLGNRRGGHDVTLALLRFVSHQLSEKFGEDPQNDPQVHQALYEHCEMAKKNLSRVQRVTIPCIFKGRSEQVEVEADTLDQLVEPYLRATLFSCEAVLNKPNPPLTWRDIHQVLLVGGSTRLRRVSGALQTLTGLVPIATPEVDTMVALGAATIARGYFKPREALIASDQFSTDIQLHKASSGCPLRNLGTRVIVWEEGRPRLDNAVIIPEHTVIPAEISREDFAIAVPNQLYFDIPVLEYDGFTGDILGTYRFHCLPQTPKGSRIRLTFRYDLSGIPEVEALDLRTGKLLYREKVECYIEPDLNNLISRSRTMDQIHDNFVDDSLVVTNISALQLQPRFDENVQFTVYRPRLVAPEIWYPLLAFAHLAERPPDAPPTEPDPLQDVKRQAEQVLAEKISRYQELTQESIQGIPKEGELTFLLELPGFELNPPRRTFRWLESVHREEFRLRASREIDGSTVRGRLSVFLGSIIIAEITLTIRVDEKQAGRSLLDISSSSSCFMFRKIFASYSRKDIVIVEEFETDLHKIGLGDEYYYDMRQLRTGEIWNHRLQELIKEANIFQLFWSWNSMGSPFVHQEWRYALSLNRPSFVRPVYWQEPFPEIPEERLPPEELRRLHFKKVYPRTLSKEPPPSPKLGPSSDGLPVLGSGRKEKAASSWGSKLSQATEACPKIDDPISHCFIAKESQEERFTKVKQRIHRLLFERLDLIQLELLEESLVAREIQQALTMLLEEEAEPLSLTEKTRGFLLKNSEGWSEPKSTFRITTICSK